MDNLQFTKGQKVRFRQDGEKMKKEQLVIGNWYTDRDGRYFQCTHESVAPNMASFRFAGEHDEYEFNLQYLTPASLLPDFSEAPETGNCFSATYGYVEYRKAYGDVWVFSGGYISYWYNGNQCYSDLHPTLFHSYEQFKAYWAEQELSMKQETGK